MKLHILKVLQYQLTNGLAGIVLRETFATLKDNGIDGLSWKENSQNHPTLHHDISAAPTQQCLWTINMTDDHHLCKERGPTLKSLWLPGPPTPSPGRRCS